MTKITVFLIIFLIFAGILGYFGLNVYSQFYKAPKDSPQGIYSFEVKKGDNLQAVAKKLEQDKVIPSRSAFLLLEKRKPITTLQAGEYVLNLQKTTPEQVIDQIDEQAKIKAEELAKLADREVVTVTFKEGDTVDKIIAKLAEAGISTTPEITAFMQNPVNFDRAKYPFLPQPLTCTYGDIKSCAKYYPEGYLYPDTYQFFKDSTLPEVTDKILANFNVKVWKNVASKVKDGNFHNVVIMASVIEKETGRPIQGVNASNLEEVNKERKTIASVFFNRLEDGMKWGSDPTGTYWSGTTFCQQTLQKIDNCIFLDSPEANNLYNTYQITDYPIGPITSPQVDNILAVLEPLDTNYLFFVSDANGKKYFAATGDEHDNNIVRVQQINREMGR